MASITDLTRCTLNQGTVDEKTFEVEIQKSPNGSTYTCKGAIEGSRALFMKFKLQPSSEHERSDCFNLNGNYEIKEIDGQVLSKDTLRGTFNLNSCTFQPSGYADARVWTLTRPNP